MLLGHLRLVATGAVAHPAPSPDREFFPQAQAAGLESGRAIVEVSGAGAATVWATETLDVRSSGAGSMEYYGHPSITQNVSLVGRLVNRGDAP